ncbi:MAG: exodeoxyribonuclease VII large subunit [Lentisphaeria bacterium]|nr:exodeoxyribonuclease VII large subunit [Lentisphaeria bacterium]
MQQSEPVWSVSAVNRALRETIEGAFMPFWMGGEAGSLILHRSGHAYFQLKDDKSQIRACYFGGAAECRRLGIGNGSLVEVWGNLSVYEVRGEYQFNIKKIRLAGIGALQQRFDELKRKLDAEGLFSPERKKAIPLLPRKIGVVTSPTGAAVRDFLQIINRRFPDVNVQIYPALVQGPQAAAQVAAGVAFFNRTRSVDVIVVTRGGGSMEDLWPFNEEIVARAVAGSSIPVISAVGHEIDFTICDFAADLRVPTPSAAAELVIGRREEFFSRLERAGKDLSAILQLRISNYRNRLERLAGNPVFHEPRRALDVKRQYLDEMELRLLHCAQNHHTRQEHRLEKAWAALNTLNPARQLERGYAMVFSPDSGTVVTTAKVAPGTRLELQFADGKLPVETVETAE